MIQACNPGISISSVSPIYVDNCLLCRSEDVLVIVLKFGIVYYICTKIEASLQGYSNFELPF